MTVGVAVPVMTELLSDTIEDELVVVRSDVEPARESERFHQSKNIPELADDVEVDFVVVGRDIDAAG